MNLGFIILAHNQPDSIQRLVSILATDEHQIVIHFDKSASSADQDAVAKIAAAHPGQVRIISKEHCVWGEWSLVEAVLHALREFDSMPHAPDYIHLMSGADFPIRPIADFKEFLKRNPDFDFIECCDISQRAWVKGGLGRERFRFYYPVNFRTSRKTFDRLIRWQRKLKIRRKMPRDLYPHMGSQWWTMRWSTCKKVIDYTRDHPEVPKFFRSTWIPDESYFQTLVARLIPKKQIADLQLMFHHLTPSGRPYVFYNDHLHVVKRLPHFFVRKISPHAKELWTNLYNPGQSQRRIPSRKLLAAVRNLVQAKIDLNHKFTTNVPGYYQDKLPTVVKSADDCAPVPVRPVMLDSGITRPVVVLLLEDDSRLEEIAAMIRSNPGLCWLGRPYAPHGIRMPAEQLARIGLKEKSHKLRDFFSRQFVRYLVESAPLDKIPVAAVLPLTDLADLESMGQIDRLLPLLVSTPMMKFHVLSHLQAAVFERSPAVFARSIHVDLAEIEGVLQDLIHA